MLNFRVTIDALAIVMLRFSWLSSYIAMDKNGKTIHPGSAMIAQSRSKELQMDTSTVVSPLSHLFLRVVEHGTWYWWNHLTRAVLQRCAMSWFSAASPACR